MRTSPPTTSPAPGAYRYDRRRRPQRSALVARAIELQDTCSTMTAVEYLKSHQFGAQVIIRVLFDRDERRAEGSASAEQA